jgi:hypothetical protein
MKKRQALLDTTFHLLVRGNATPLHSCAHSCCVASLFWTPRGFVASAFAIGGFGVMPLLLLTHPSLQKKKPSKLHAPLPGKS